ncbi:MAG: hypothetical protein JOS17DRAFT_821902 [Linnemannia elongata]|nr:MAG: hypothetical protein JOS17DRAFT_821902 [Linnemannia elongata]
MGIPIPVIEVDADRVVRSNICLAADCQCPECNHRHIIRLGSAIRQTLRQDLQSFSSAASGATVTGTAAATPSGYIDTRLPDYRRRGTLGYRGPPLPQILSSSSASVSNFLSPSSMMGTGVGGGGGGGGGSGSREPFTASPTSIVDSGQDQDLHEEYEQEQWSGGREGTGQMEVAFDAATLEDQSHNQHPYQFQPQSQHQIHQRPPPSSPLMRMRARAQEWASRMDGVDYYHDSDPEDLLVTGGGGGGGGGGSGRQKTSTDTSNGASALLCTKVSTKTYINFCTETYEISIIANNTDSTTIIVTNGPITTAFWGWQWGCLNNDATKVWSDGRRGKEGQEDGYRQGCEVAVMATSITVTIHLALLLIVIFVFFADANTVQAAPVGNGVTVPESSSSTERTERTEWNYWDTSRDTSSGWTCSSATTTDRALNLPNPQRSSPKRYQQQPIFNSLGGAQDQYSND